MTFIDGQWWFSVRDGDWRALALYLRHYSATKRRGAKPRARGYREERIAGPGQHMILLTPTADALFVWRVQGYRRDHQTGIECSLFRNEGPRRSSDLIREAAELAWQRWGVARLFTFVDVRRTRSSNPGYCFLMAGWRRVDGHTTKRLRLLECCP